MSARALQRVIVRMLHDPAFTARVYEDPARALAGLPLGPREHRWLLAVDRRAFGVDPLRRHRVLNAILDEHTAALALLAPAGRGLERLEAYLSSADFHEAIQARRSVILAFGPWLLGWVDEPRARGAIALEHAIAAARRAPARPAPGRRRIDRQELAALDLAPGVRVVAAPAGTLALVTELRARLGAHPVAAALEARFEPPAAQVDPSRVEHVIVEPSAGDVTIGEVPEALFRLLEGAAAGVSAAALRALTEAEGLSPVEAQEVLDDLVADGLLVPRAGGASSAGSPGSP